MATDQRRASAPALEKGDERLETLYDIREELQLIADADCEFSSYAANGLEALREAGYDV